MTDVPIIFSAPMVRALLDGRKTMTRRLAWRPVTVGSAAVECKHGYDHCPTCDAPKPSPWQKVKPGDRLYVREAFKLVGGDPGSPIYRANWREDSKARGFDNIPDTDPGGWKPSIHMPRWASRLTLVVTATKIEPVQAISEEDARAEGVEGIYGAPFYPETMMADTRRFELLWKCLHGEDCWDRNPEVVCLSFRAHKANIDRMQDAA